MMEPESGRHMSAQEAKEFLMAIWLELLEWGAIAFNAAGTLFTAIFNFAMLAVATAIASLAVIVLILREKMANPSEDSPFSLIGIKALSKRTGHSVSH